MSLSPLSYVGFKKWPYRLVDFRGQGPSYAKAGIHVRTGSCRQPLLLSLQWTLNGINKWDGNFLCLLEGALWGSGVGAPDGAPGNE